MYILQMTSVSNLKPDAETQTSFSQDNIEFLSDAKARKYQRKLFMREIMKSDKTCMHYTGFPTKNVAKMTFRWLEPSARYLNLWEGKRKRNNNNKKKQRKNMTLFEEFIMAIVKIRRNYDNDHLGYLFGVSPQYVGKVFVSWVSFLDEVLSPLLEWPSRKITEENLPEAFKNYRRTRAIIDCTEFKVQKPFRPAAQRALWSNYKQTNTFKQLVAVGPPGQIIFLSNVYNGNVSDLGIVKSCGFINKVEENDDIMADRGINIRHLLLKKKATLNIPAFSNGKCLSSKGVTKSRKIASVRIHVERAIRRMKTFKILSGVIPLTLRFQIAPITRIVAVLCNLQPRLC